MNCSLRIVGLLALISLAVSANAAPEATLVPFRLEAPQAQAVFLAGEFNHWSTSATPMQRDGQGRWSVSVPLLEGQHSYKFLIDGKWEIDPMNPEVTTDGFGGKNSVVKVIDDRIDPVVEEKDAVGAEAARLLGQGEFAALEKRAQEYRETKACYSDGLWMLTNFYDGLGAENEMRDHADWQPWFEKIERWGREFPESITQPVVLANGWRKYAEEARSVAPPGDEKARATGQGTPRKSAHHP